MKKLINKSQVYYWYWSPEWQTAEHEADEDIAAGRVRSFDNVEDAIAHLRNKQRVVELTSSQRPTRRRQFGSAKGLITTADDFDAPLPDFAEYTE